MVQFLVKSWYKVYIPHGNSPNTRRVYQPSTTLSIRTNTLITDSEILLYLIKILKVLFSAMEMFFWILKVFNISYNVLAATMI